MASSSKKYLYTDISQIYEFFEVLGEGSFSKVYKAKFLPSGEIIAKSLKLTGNGTGGVITSIQCGQATSTSILLVTTVTFNPAFNTAPYVVATVTITGGYYVNVRSVTASGFEFATYQGSIGASGVTINWVAITII